MIVERFEDVLQEITVDAFHFRVTRNPFAANSCILWFCDMKMSHSFEALGQFSRFDRRGVLDFISRYATNPALRKEIRKRKFLRRLDGLSPAALERFERMGHIERHQAYRNLFCLDGVVERSELELQRKLMARRFHPDVGGSDRCMRVVNEAFSYMASFARS